MIELPSPNHAARQSTVDVLVFHYTELPLDESLNVLRDGKRAMLVITHYERLLRYIVPDRVHVLVDGRVVDSGGKELARELEANGYRKYGINEDATHPQPA